MRLTIVCNPDDQWEAERVADEAKLKNLEAEILHYENFQVKIVESEFRIFYKDIDWQIPEMTVFRSSNYLSKKIRYEELAFVLRDATHRNGGRILNFEAMKIGPFGKLRQQYELSKSQMSGVDTYYGVREMPYLPIVQKPLQGSSGDGVRLISSLQELKLDELSVYQKVMESGCDYRVMVVDGVALGAIERRAVKGKFVANVSKGASASSIELPKDVLKLAVDASGMFGLEYAGIDLIKDIDGGWHILEINRFSQFQGFEKATGINVAGAVVNLMLKKKD